MSADDHVKKNKPEALRAMKVIPGARPERKPILPPLERRIMKLTFASIVTLAVFITFPIVAGLVSAAAGGYGVVRVTRWAVRQDRRERTIVSLEGLLKQ